MLAASDIDLAQVSREEKSAAIEALEGTDRREAQRLLYALYPPVIRVWTGPSIQQGLIKRGQVLHARDLYPTRSMPAQKCVDFSVPDAPAIGGHRRCTMPFRVAGQGEVHRAAGFIARNLPALARRAPRQYQQRCACKTASRLAVNLCIHRPTSGLPAALIAVRSAAA